MPATADAIESVGDGCTLHVDDVGIERFSGIIAKRNVVHERLARNAVATDDDFRLTNKAFSVRGAVVQLYSGVSNHEATV